MKALVGYVITERGRLLLQPPSAPQPVTIGRRPGEVEPYDGAELRPFMDRPGANDAFMWPSRHGNKLTWRDGRVERFKVTA